MPTPTLHPFYAKSFDAEGIPVVSSTRVPDEALAAAQAIVAQMLAQRPDVRQALIDRGVKVAVMAESEVTTDIPEHAFLKADTNTDWDRRARGLGGTVFVPTTSGAEENLLCYGRDRDRFFGESILIHEFAHTIMNLGLPFVAGGDTLLGQLREAYGKAIAQGRWDQTYAATNVEEYWAEAVQSWFGANLFSDPPDGIHNQVSTREALKSYDPGLWTLIGQVFGEWTYACTSSAG